jgi:hypothetical protein
MLDLKDCYFMIYLQNEEQLALKYILKNWVIHVTMHQSCSTDLDLAKDLDGSEPDSFVLPMDRTAVFRSAIESFYLKPTLPRAQAIIGSKHYEMLAKWFFDEKVSMTKEEVLNLHSHYNKPE